MNTKREKLIADLKAQQETALHDFDEKIAVYLNRLKATDIVQTRTGWQPNKDMTQFIKLFKHGTCGKIIEAFKELQRGLHERKLRLDDLNGIYNGVITVVDEHREKGDAPLLEKGLLYVKAYCENNCIKPSNDVNIVVMFEDLKRARRYSWSEKKQEWFFHEMNYEDMWCLLRISEQGVIKMTSREKLIADLQIKIENGLIEMEETVARKKTVVDALNMVQFTIGSNHVDVVNLLTKEAEDIQRAVKKFLEYKASLDDRIWDLEIITDGVLTLSADQEVSVTTVYLPSFCKELHVEPHKGMMIDVLFKDSKKVFRFEYNENAQNWAIHHMLNLEDFLIAHDLELDKESK